MVRVRVYHFITYDAYLFGGVSASLTRVSVHAYIYGAGPREGQYDELVFDQVAEGDVKRAMEGKTLTGAFRKGKQMWVVLAEEEGAGAGAGSKKKQPPKKGGKGGGGGQGGQQQQQHVLLHMGMTGSLVVKGKEVPQVNKRERF